MPTEIAISWRTQGSRYRGPIEPIGVEIDDDADTMRIVDNLKNRPEVHENHGQIKEWAGVLVQTAHEWQYNEQAAREMVAGAAAQLNGRGVEFIEAAEAALAEVYSQE